MYAYTDDIIDTVTKHLPTSENEWELVGFINKDNEIYPFGSDSKIIGRLFEVIAKNSLLDAAEELGYVLDESDKQTVYPDFYFIKPNGRKIAIDIKTTYRKFNKSGTVSKFGFTGGSFTSYMRNDTKNIVGNYSEYDDHYIMGILYTRETEPTIEKQDLTKLNDIVPAYHSPEVFIQKKFRIASDKKGSGNTDNIGTILSNKIEAFQYGAGPFSFLGEDAFKLYWKNHPLYKDSKETKDTLYKNFETFFKWLEGTNPELSKDYSEKYQEYLKFKQEKNW